MEFLSVSSVDVAVGNLICLKIDSSPTFFFYSGTDVIFNKVKWVGGSRGVFRSINGSSTGFPHGTQIYNSSIVSGPIDGVTPCLTSGGGIQFGQPSDPPIYGNVVYNLTISNTSDDSIAMFNDIGTGPTQSHIQGATITGSFVRSILALEDTSRIYNQNASCPGVGKGTDPNVATLPCKSPVSIDSATLSKVTACDPLVFGNSQVPPYASNCPVMYSP